MSFVRKWLNNVWYSHTLEYDSVIERNEPLIRHGLDVSQRNYAL